MSTDQSDESLEASHEETSDSGESGTKPGGRRTKQKGSTTDSHGGRNRPNDDGVDEFETIADSPQAQAAQRTLQALLTEDQGNANPTAVGQSPDEDATGDSTELTAPQDDSLPDGVRFITQDQEVPDGWQEIKEQAGGRLIVNPDAVSEGGLDLTGFSSVYGDGQDESDADDRDTITWDTAREGDKIAFQTEDGPAAGTVTEDARDGFGILWVSRDDEPGEYAVREADFMASVDDRSLDGDSISAPDDDLPSVEWLTDNIFLDQSVLFSDDDGIVYEGTVSDMFLTGGKVTQITVDSAEISGSTRFTGAGFQPASGDNTYQLDSVQSWADLDRSEQNNRLIRTFQNHTNIFNMPSHTEQNIRLNMRQAVIDGFADSRIAKTLVQHFEFAEDFVNRASCGGNAGSGGNEFYLKAPKNIDVSTLNHEMGHATVRSHGYDIAIYEQSQWDSMSQKKRDHSPIGIAHNYSKMRALTGPGSYIQFDFSQSSSFHEPSAYMLRKGSDISDDAIGFDAWKHEVEVEVAGEAEFKKADFDDVSEESNEPILDQLQEGDVIQVDLPNQSEPLSLQRGEYQYEGYGGTTYGFYTEDGTAQDVYYSEKGNLKITDIANDANIIGADTSTYRKHTSPEEWSWFNESPDTAEEKVENLAKAANKAWYRQAKHFENDGANEKQYYMQKSGYSSTNAQETLAQAHETIQNRHQDNIEKITNTHPEFMIAYSQVFELPSEAEQALNQYADKHNIDL